MIDRFSKAFLISLERRADRRERFAEMLRTAGISEPVEWFRAFDGHANQPPPGWQPVGAWGCYISHLHILLNAIRDRLESYIVFEDDAILLDTTVADSVAFMDAAPSDWDMLFFGGQHKVQPSHRNGFVQCRNTTRTHCYAVHSRHYGRFLAALLDMRTFVKRNTWHIDHQIGQLMPEWKVFAPTFFTVGQGGDVSDISDNEDCPVRFWHAETAANILTREIVAVPFRPNARPSDFAFRGKPLFFGAHLIGGTTLAKTYHREALRGDAQLRAFIAGIVKQSLKVGNLAAFPLIPGVTVERLRRVWGGPVVEF